MDETTFKQFLADVMTAAGLVAHGKRCKALSERLASRVMELYAALPMTPSVLVRRSIETDDEVEALAKECGWDNRCYMTPADYKIWCDRMRNFARLAAAPKPGEK